MDWIEGKTLQDFMKDTKEPKKFISSTDLNKNKFRAIADYISGMTDRFAINLYKSKI